MHSCPRKQGKSASRLGKMQQREQAGTDQKAVARGATVRQINQISRGPKLY